MKTLLWFRQDLRLTDNPALTHACERGEVIPVFILDENDRQLGGATKWWLHHSIANLEAALGRLVLRSGDPLSILKSLVNETNADAVFWNRSYEPHSVTRDTAIKAELQNNPKITSISASHSRPTGFQNSSSNLSWDGKNPEDDFVIVYETVAPDYVSTIEAELLEIIKRKTNSRL